MEFNIQVLTWIMTTIGFTGFILVGKKLWWAWYVNLGVQILWAIYALATGQPAFLASAATYFLIFALNAYKWTKDEQKARKFRETVSKLPIGGMVLHNGVEITRNEDPVSADEYREQHFKRAIPLIAEICHEANRILQMANNEEASLHWRQAPQWQKDSAIEGVKAALEGQTAEELHESWCRAKIADGWYFGPIKDAEMKTHPCLVPYSQLPKEQRIKDHMFRAIVKSFKLQQQYAHV